MKKVGLLWCFIPWIVYALIKLVGGGWVEQEIFAFAWLAVSPFVTGMVMWFANTEGYREAIGGTAIAEEAGTAQGS